MFIEDYCSYAGELTDSPMIFHEFVGYFLLSAAAGNKIYFRFGDQKIYPNLWTILLAPSSLFRKSTSIGIGCRLLYRVNPDLILPTEFTQEKLMDILAKQPQGVLTLYEFTNFLGLLQKDYMSGTKAFLTELFDSPPLYSRKTLHKTLEIKNPCLSILSATTAEWFLDRTRENDMLGGFLPRFIFVPAIHKEKTLAFPKLVDQSKQNDLVKALHKIHEMEGEAIFGEKARKVYKEWLLKYETTNMRDQGFLTGFYSRLETYALKFSLLFQLATNQELNITPEAVKKGTHIVTFLTAKLKELEKTEFAFNRFQQKAKKILKLIDKEGISRAELLQRSHLSSRELNEVLETLVSSEQIMTKMKGREGQKKKTFYCLNEDKS